MADREWKGLYYKYDEKYVKGHLFFKKNLFHKDVNSTPKIQYLVQEDPSKEDTNEKPLQVPNTIKPSTSNKESIISLHPLSDISTLNTFKIKGYIKYHQLVMVIDNRNIHNFINMFKYMALHIFIHPSNNF